MAPTKKALTDALRAAVTHAYHHDRDTLTVKRIRNKVEQNLDLEEGFFLSPTWKDQSKEIITSRVSQLDEDDEEDSKLPTPKKVKKEVKKEPIPAKKPIKRASNGGASQPAKRQKKEATPSDEESALSSLADSDVSEAPKPTKAGAAAARKSNAKSKVESDEDELKSEESEEEKPKSRRRSAKQESDDEEEEFKDEESEDEAKQQTTKRETISKPESDSDELSDLKSEDEDEEEETKPSVKKEVKTKLETIEKVESEEDAAVKNDDSDSEMSIVLDEAPKAKRQRKSSEPSKAKKPAKAAAEVTPDEAEIKKLQSQLTKCGIRKIWGIELKKAGDEPKARIRYLKDMLRDVGMDGRFSDARAREIREARELAADLEAVKGGEELWGVGRSSRNKKGKNLQEESGSEEEEERFEPRAARAKAGLAFLGSESEDSD